MDRALVIYGALFLAIPLLLALGALFLPGMAFGFTIALIAILSFGFLWGIAFLDIREA